MKIGIELMVGRHIAGIDTPIGGDFRVLLCLASICQQLGHDTYVLIERNSADREFVDTGVHFIYYDRLCYYDHPTLGGLPYFDVLVTHLNHLVLEVIPRLPYKPRVFYFTTGIPDDPRYDLTQCEALLTHNTAVVRLMEEQIPTKLLLHYTPDVRVERDKFKLVHATTELYSDIRPLSAISVAAALHDIDPRYTMDLYYVPIWLDGIIECLEERRARGQGIADDQSHLDLAYKMKDIIASGVEGVSFKEFLPWSDFQRELAGAGFLISTRPGAFAMGIYEAMSHGTIPVTPKSDYSSLSADCTLNPPERYQNELPLFEEEFVNLILWLSSHFDDVSRFVRNINPMSRQGMLERVRCILGDSK